MLVDEYCLVNNFKNGHSKGKHLVFLVLEGTNDTTGLSPNKSSTEFTKPCNREMLQIIIHQQIK
jgi:hypothetical protein